MQRRRGLMPMAPALTLVLFALVFSACGGSTPGTEQGVTPLRPRSTPAAAPSASVDSTCPDPYVEGSPYPQTPGAPIRLRPEGSPTAVERPSLLPFVPDPSLERAVRRSLRQDGWAEEPDGESRWAIMVKNLADGRGVALYTDRTFYAASLFKTWVMLEAFHQRDEGLLDFGERYVVSDYYKTFGLNPGELDACSEVTIGEALSRMLAVSDNVAANLVLDRVGAGNVNATLRRLGMEESGVPADGSLPTTAADMAVLLEAIARRQAVSEAASEEMLSLLASESIGDRLPALLPDDVVVAHKTGNWENATHDAGIVISPGASYLIVVLTDFGFQDDGAGPIARLSRVVYDYVHQN